MQPLADKRNATEIVWVLSDDVVDIGIDHFCGQNVPHRVEMVVPVVDFFKKAQARSLAKRSHLPLT